MELVNLEEIDAELSNIEYQKVDNLLDESRSMEGTDISLFMSQYFFTIQYSKTLDDLAIAEAISAIEMDLRKEDKRNSSIGEGNYFIHHIFCNT